MKTLLAILSILAVVLTMPAQAAAKKKGGGPAQPPELRITEVDAVSIIVDVGKDGNTHEKYKITDATKVTLDGAPAFARDLKPGMMARIEATPDHITALSITARDPPAHPSKHRVG